MILVELFFTQDLVPETEGEAQAHQEEQRILGKDKAFLRKRAHNALAKATKEEPTVRKLLFLRLPIIRRYYSVRNRWPGSNEYIVLLLRDRDGRWWIDCSCPAGNPPATSLKQRVKKARARLSGAAQWQPVPCYHSAAVLIHASKTASALRAKQEKRNKRNNDKKL